MKTEKDQLFQDIEFHLMNDHKPSQYLNKIVDTPLFRNYPFDYLYFLKGLEQSPKFHPEGDVWTHTMLVVNEAAKVKQKSTDAKTFMWSALLHDIGKSKTTKMRKGRITSYDHDKVGATLTQEFLKEFTDDTEFIQSVVNLVRYHMHILYITRQLPFADKKGLKSQKNIQDIALLGWCDRMGRLNADPVLERKNIELFRRML